MATTEYTDTSFAVGSIQARTDPAGGAVVDVNGEELRLYASAFTPGVLGTGHYPVLPGPGMSVEVGSGSPESDVAYVNGVVGQGIYVVRHELGTTNVTVPASDLANSRIDEVYVIVADDPYDSSTLSLPRLALRVGDPATSPVAPGPDPGWSASLLLATLAIEAASTTVEANDITDERVTAGLAFDLNATDFDGVLQSVFDQHVDDAENTYIPLAGGRVATTLEVSGDVNLATIRARTNDIHFEDVGGATILRWDTSQNRWEFSKTVEMQGQFLQNPSNPTLASHVGDRGYNDARYLALGDRYTDGEAVSAMGSLSNSNDYRHNRYTNAEAVAATDNAQLVTGGVASVIPSGISSNTYTLVAQFNVAKPAGWGTAKVVVRAFLQQAGVSGANMQMQGYVRIDGTNGPSVQDGVSEIGEDPSISVVIDKNTTDANIDIDVWARNALSNAATSTGKYADINYTLYRLS